MSTPNVEFRGITPYLHYDDVPRMIEWLTRVFGFSEKGRWLDAQGAVQNAELVVGSTDVWLDGDPQWWKTRGRRPEEWIGVWVDNVDAMYERVKTCDLNPEPPQNKFYAVRVLQGTDPEGYTWGFMQRCPYVARSPE